MVRKRKGKPSLKNCSWNEIIKAVRKLEGLIVDEGATNHAQIKHEKTGGKFPIPRNNPVDSYIVKDFVKNFLVKERGYSEKEIYKHLWC